MVVIILALTGVGVYVVTRQSVQSQIATPTAQLEDKKVAPPVVVPVAEPAPVPLPAAPTPTAPKPTPTPKPTPKPGTYTMTEVKKHNSASSCWSVINGGVYNLTSWIGQHPGGEDAILGLCGTDGSAAFNDQHGTQRRPTNELAGFKIGTLAN